MVDSIVCRYYNFPVVKDLANKYVSKNVFANVHIKL